MQTTETDSPRGRPSLRLNALSNFGSLAVNVAVGFFLTPAMLNFLGEKRYGIWTLAASLVGYFGLLEFGVGGAVFRYVPLYHGQGNHHRVGAVISTSLAFYGILSLSIVLLTQIFAYPLAGFFNGGPELAGLLRLIGVGTALSLPAIILNTATASYESFVPANMVAIVTNVLRGALLFGCVFGGYGLVAMGWAAVLANLTSLMGNIFVFRRVCRGVEIGPKSVNWSELKPLLSFGSVILIFGTANSLATESPKQIVAKTISLEALGLFGVPLLLISYYRMSIISLTKVFSPRFSYLSGQVDIPEIRRLYLRGCRYISMLAGAVGLLLCVAGPSFLLLWTKKPQLAEAAAPLAIMTAGTFVFLSHRLGGDLLFGLGLQWKYAVLELTEALGIVGLTIPLSLKFGILGAGLGLALPPILVRGLLQTRFVCQSLSVSFLEYYSKCILRSWVVVAVLWGLAQAVDWRSIITGWVSLCAVSAGLLLSYGLLLFLFVLDSQERTQFKREGFRWIGKLGLGYNGKAGSPISRS